MDKKDKDVQQTGVKHALSASGRSKTHSCIPVRKITETLKPGARVTIRSLNDLDNLTEDFFELLPLPQINVTADLDKENDVFDKETSHARAAGFRKRAKSFNEKLSVQVDRGKKQGLHKVKEHLSSLSKNIDSLTTNKEEVVKASNTKMPAAFPRSKTTHSLYENQTKKLGVQLKRCLSLYDRKRNPHFCTNHVSSETDEISRQWGYGIVKSGPLAVESRMRKEKSRPWTGSPITPDRLKTERRTSTASERSAVERRASTTLEMSRTEREISSTLDRGEDTDRTSTMTSVTSGSMMSSTLSLESGDSSELDFDTLILCNGSTANSPAAARQSLIPKPIRPRSATLCVNNGINRERRHDGLVHVKQTQERKIKRSLSMYEKKVSSFSDGSVSIRIRQTIRSGSVHASESSHSSLDDVFSVAPTSSKIKAVS